MKKFGILKKASVLLFYGRANDAFDEIAKAAQIIKNQREEERENELQVQKRWQFKLNLPDGLELPKPVEKIRQEDVTEAFLKQIDSGNADTSTLKLYIEKVCPLIRNQYDKNTFLNGLIEDLYFKCEDIMVEKQNTIQKIQKKVEELTEINELYEALGSDAEKDAEGMLDNDGKPIKIRKKKTKMCDANYKKAAYKDDGIEMKKKKDGGDKYYVNVCQDCPKGKACPHAHTAIELDLIPNNQIIKNLNGIVKTQTIKLKNAKPLEPWRPSAADFKTSGKL